MTALAIKDMPGFELSEMEASDAALGKNTYTCLRILFVRLVEDDLFADHLHNRGVGSLRNRLRDHPGIVNTVFQDGDLQKKGFKFFQDFLRKQGILEQLEALDIKEGSTVRMYGLSFDYYK